MTISDVARFLFALGLVLAIAGPAIATFRIVGKYRLAKEVTGSYEDVEALVQPATVRANALRDATWSVVEFGLVALGVVCTSIASLLLIP